MSASDERHPPRRRIRRFAFWVCAALLLLVAATAVALPRLVDPERYRPRLEALLEESTGWSVDLGELGFSVWRGLVVTVQPLAMRAPGEDGSSIDVRTLEVRAALWPLLRGELEVERIGLVDPDVRVVRRTADEGWAIPVPVRVEPDSDESGVAVTIDYVEISGGRVSVEDRTGTLPAPLALEGVAGRFEPQAGLTEGSAELAGGGRLEWTGSFNASPRVELDLSEVPAALLGPWVGADVIGREGTIDGRLNVEGATEVGGTLRGRGIRLLGGADTLDVLDVEFEIRPEASDRWLADRIEIEADGVTLTGRGAIAPDLALALELPETPLEPVLAASRKVFPIPLELEPPGRVSAVISIDKPAERPLTYTARGRLACASARVVEFLPPAEQLESGFELSRDGLLKIRLDEGRLAGGPLRGDAVVKPLYPPGRLTFQGALNGAALGGLLTGFVPEAGRKIEGPTDVQTRVELDLARPEIDLSALTGTLDFSSKDVSMPGWDLRGAIYQRIADDLGKLEEIAALAAKFDRNLAQKLGRSAQQARELEPQAAGQAAERLLDRLSGNVSFSGSPWSLDRFEFAAGAVSASGNGTFDPTRGAVDVELNASLGAEETARLVARYPQLESLVARDGRLAVPVGVRGPLTTPRIDVDLGQMTRSALASAAPEAAAKDEVKQQLEQKVKEKAQGLLEGLLGSKRKKSGAREEETAAAEPPPDEQTEAPAPPDEAPEP